MRAFDFSANSCHNTVFATTPFHLLSSSNHLTTLKLQRHVSIRERQSIRVVRITASLWPNTDSTASPPSPMESNGALEINGAVNSPYSFLKCDGSKTVHAGTIICLIFFLSKRKYLSLFFNGSFLLISWPTEKLIYRIVIL